VKRLIVNADDFGRSAGVNAGVVTGHEEGIVTSASLMVSQPAAAEAAAYARAHASLAVGLHLDLGEWTYVDGRWQTTYLRAAAGDEEQEVLRQLAQFRRLLGCDPTHLDSHQHVHRDAPVREIVTAVGAELGVPVRHVTRAIQYCGAFYGQTSTGEPLPHVLTTAAIVRIIEALPEGTTELCCHPARELDFPTGYAHERVRELEVLCDPSVRAAIERAGVELCSFRDVRRMSTRR
jgi:chitin disaccharide deacetylase